MYDFLDGLLHALSWDSEKTNVILGNHLSWPYTLGIVINFLVCLSVFVLVVRSLVKNTKKSGGWRNYWSHYYQNRISIVGRTLFWLTVPLPLLFIVCITVYFLGFRVVNGLTRYHYFTSQELSPTYALVTIKDTNIGNYRSQYSKLVLQVHIAGASQTVNVSNSSKTIARYFRSLEGNIYPALVEVNSNNEIVYISNILID
ncbi:hypothetical protein HPA07_02885 [Streptococcus suis]|uniref:hypothetical protein n=1 Tax=Streptococcus suis TaxID=1307 RepID=UPI0005CD3F54|nr:hypothetical protein [Streptococcus suis]MBM7154719.1 hypothetical protein [Streptococcus suis]MDG4504517.1 hypothetical protein [Streptococcus suis]MDY7283168.1 hypothetical protein [Streptococcus suis]NQG78025.1 hypothetical protein [Streptococcus suis]NQN47431.1 hypothetical protein [Streptococcus suis]